MAIAAVFLDLYQTLAYFHPPREQRMCLALQEFGFDVDEASLSRGYLAADHYYTLAGIESPLFAMPREERRRIYNRYQEVLLEAVGLPEAVPLAVPIYHRYWEMERKFCLFSDVEQALVDLSAGGYRLAVITNVTEDPTADLARVGIRDRFEGVIASCLVGCEKPDPHIFRAALETLGVEPHQVVHVGDQYEADVEGARAAGITSVLLDRHDLQEGRHPNRIRSLTELAPLLANGLIRD